MNEASIIETEKFSEVDSTVGEVFDKLIQFPEFYSIREAKIRFLFNKKEIKTKGKIQLGRASNFSEKDKFLHSYQFLILLDRAFWEQYPAKREPLLHHELSHLNLVDGETEILPHDIEEFESTVTRYGAWLKDLESFSEQLQLFAHREEVASVK